ncbi:hypothetical protein [Streptomyces sp. NPDC054962]
MQLLALGFGALVYALIEGPARGWTDTRVLPLSAAAAVALLTFVAVELRTTDPMLDLHFFRDPVLSGAEVTAFMISFGMFGASFFLPLLLQDVMGWSQSSAGLAGLPMTALIVIAAPLSGAFTARCNPRIPLAGMTSGRCGLAAQGLSSLPASCRSCSYDTGGGAASVSSRALRSWLLAEMPSLGKIL